MPASAAGKARRAGRRPPQRAGCAEPPASVAGKARRLHCEASWKVSSAAAAGVGVREAERKKEGGDTQCASVVAEGMGRQRRPVEGRWRHRRVGVPGWRETRVAAATAVVCRSRLGFGGWVWLFIYDGWD
jgi:hypothetical protein